MLKAQIVQVGGYLGSARRCDHGEKAAREKPGCGRGLRTHWQYSWQTGARRRPARGRPGFWELEPGADRALPRGRLQGVETASRAEGGEAGPPAMLLSWEAGPPGAWEDTVFTQPVQLSPG